MGVHEGFGVGAADILIFRFPLQCGVIGVFSLVQIAKVIPEILHGLEQIQEADEVFEERNERLVKQDAG